MEMIIGQLRYFLFSLLYGILLMVCYDFFGVFRHFVRHGKIAIWVEDWLFWCVAAVIVFQMIFALNYGMIRFFFVGSLILGMWLYRKLVGQHPIRWICAVFGWLFRPYVWIKKKITKKMAKNSKSP